MRKREEGKCLSVRFLKLKIERRMVMRMNAQDQHYDDKASSSVTFERVDL